ncbi:MAG: M1 family aminopeptidase, partial [Anaerolineae bacterium]
MVGSDQIENPWLDESLTSYSVMLYYEEVYGEQRAQGILNGEFRATHNQLIARGEDLPIGLPADEYGPNPYWDVIYRKGPLYFQALRERLGDELFFEFLQTYYEDHRYGIATPESFLATLERV